MKTKFVVIAITLLFVLSSLGFAYYKATDWLDFDVSMKVLNKNPLSIVTGGLELQLDLTMKNYSNLKLYVSQLKVDLLTPAGVLLAYQKQPLTNSVEIPANSNNAIISLLYHVPVTGLTALTKELSKSTTITTLAGNYFSSGKFGVSLKTKGYVRANFGIRLAMDDIIEV